MTDARDGERVTALDARQAGDVVRAVVAERAGSRA